MNKQGEGKLGIIIIAFITIIVAVVLLQAMFNPVNEVTTLQTITNVSVTLGAANVSTAISGREVVGTPEVINGSDAAMVISTENVTVVESLSDGDLSIRLTPITEEWAAGTVNVTYQLKPDGYDNSSAGRSIFAIILIFGALAIVASVVPGFKEFLTK